MSEIFFSPCPRGLEALLAEEIAACGAESVETVPGGVSYHGELHVMYAVNLHSRLATRVLWMQAQGNYQTEKDIYEIANAINWPALFNVDSTIRVYVTAIKCPLKSLDFITLTVKDAICDRFREDCGVRPSVCIPRPDLRIHVFIEKNHVIVYLDTSGEPLYKRFGRPGHHEAPLKENLAAGLLMLSGWEPSQPLIDPMCGGGPFLIESVQRALNIAPGLQRQFAFERCLFYAGTVWESMRTKAQNERLPNRPLQIFGSDKYGDALKVAKLNLEAARLADCVTLKQVNILELTPPFKNGVAIMNPPYGVRLTQSDPDFFTAIGNRLKHYFSDFSVWMLSADLDLPKQLRLHPKRRIPVYNGNLECRLFGFDIKSGAFRRQKAGTANEGSELSQEKEE